MGFQTKKLIFGNNHDKSHIIKYLQMIIFVLLLSDNVNCINRVDDILK